MREYKGHGDFFSSLFLHESASTLNAQGLQGAIYIINEFFLSYFGCGSTKIDIFQQNNSNEFH
jgi:hypothetical protein